MDKKGYGALVWVLVAIIIVMSFIYLYSSSFDRDVKSICYKDDLSYFRQSGNIFMCIGDIDNQEIYIFKSHIDLTGISFEVQQLDGSG